MTIETQTPKAPEARKRKRRDETTPSDGEPPAKGQFISERNFDDIKSPKKQITFLKDFYRSHTYMMSNFLGAFGIFMKESHCKSIKKSL